jgi:hypothetical protein
MAEGIIEATGDHVVATTGGLTLSKIRSCMVPCCKSCHKRSRNYTLLALAALLLPWCILVPLTFIEATSRMLQAHILVVMAVLFLCMGLGIILFWCRIFFVRAIRLYMPGGKVAGLVFRHQSFAEDTAKLNARSIRKVSGFKAW